MPQQGDLMGLVLPIAMFMAIFYFLILRPQKKKQKQHEDMINGIGRGDSVVTAGGFFGVVRDVLEDSFIIEVADGVKMRILKASISARRDASAPKQVASKGKSIYAYEPNNPVSKAYGELTREVLADGKKERLRSSDAR